MMFKFSGLKSIGTIAFIMLSTGYIMDVNAQDQAPQQQELVSSTLAYKPQIPAPDSYHITKNTSGQEVPDSVLLKVNALRKLNENVEWKVNDDIELIIYPIKPKDAGVDK